jgi:hypothetical protein
MASEGGTGLQPVLVFILPGVEETIADVMDETAVQTRA